MRPEESVWDSGGRDEGDRTKGKGVKGSESWSHSFGEKDIKYEGGW